MMFIQEIIYLKQRIGAYVINLDEYESIETHWIALYVISEYVLYFDNFGVEHIPKENSLGIKILQQIFIEYKHLIQ